MRFTLFCCYPGQDHDLMDTLLSALNLSLSPDQVLLYGIAAMAAIVYLPYILVAYGRVSIGIDLAAPRAMFDRLPDYAKRATWAHQNSFESFAVFTAAALTVYVTGSASVATNNYILLYLAARLLFFGFYWVNWPFLRSPMWALSMVAIGGLFLASLNATV